MEKCHANPISHLSLLLMKIVQNFTVWSSSDVQGHFVVEVSHLLTQMTLRHILLFGQYKSSLSAHVYPTSYYCTHFSWLLFSSFHQIKPLSIAYFWGIKFDSSHTIWGIFLTLFLIKFAISHSFLQIKALLWTECKNCSLQ